MGALANIKKNFKEDPVVQLLGEAYLALVNQINSVEIDDVEGVEDMKTSVTKAVSMTELDDTESKKHTVIAGKLSEVLTEMEENILNSSNTFGTSTGEKDVAGFKEIKNNLNVIKAEVSEKSVQKQQNNRESDEEQRNI